MDRRIVIAAIALPLLAAGSGHLYLRWQVDRAANRMAGAVAGAGRFTWGGTTAGFDGEVGLDDVRFEREDGTLLKIERMRVGFENVLVASQYLDYESAARREPPRALSLALEGMDLRLPETEPKRGARRAAAKVGCEAEPRDLRRLTGDFRSSYAFDQEERRFTANASSDIESSARLDLSIEIETRKPVAELRDLLRAGPVLRRAQLDYTDAGAFERWIVACVERSGLPREAFVRERIEEFERNQAFWGRRMSDDLIAAYRRFLNDPRSVRITIDNAELRGIDEVSINDPGRLAAEVGLRLEVNGTPVDNLAFTRIAPSRVAPAALAGPSDDELRALTGRLAEFQLEDGSRIVGRVTEMVGEYFYLAVDDAADGKDLPVRRTSVLGIKPLEQAAMITAGPSATAIAPAPGPSAGASAAVAAPAGPQPIPLDQLPKAVGGYVQLELADGGIKLGKLVEADAYGLKLERRIGTGNVVVPIGIEDVKAAFRLAEAPGVEVPRQIATTGGARSQAAVRNSGEITDPRELGSLVGSRVQLVYGNGHVRTGRILSIDDDRMRFEEQLGMRTHETEVPLAFIKSVRPIR